MTSSPLPRSAQSPVTRGPQSPVTRGPLPHDPGRVVSLGIHILDVLGRPVSRIPPKQDVDLLEEIRFTVAGTAAGTSVDLAKLGVQVLAMGAVGEDAAGNFVVDTMQRYGIDTSGLRRKPTVQTSATMLPIRPNGERPALHVLGANAELTVEDVDFGAIATARHLHFGGTYLMPKLDGPPTARILAFARERGVPVTLDLIAIDRPDLLEVIAPALPYVDYFMPGLDEARMISGLHDRQDVIRFFLDRGVRHTVFKMGADGSSIAWRGENRPDRGNPRSRFCLSRRGLDRMWRRLLRRVHHRSVARLGSRAERKVRVRRGWSRDPRSRVRRRDCRFRSYIRVHAAR
jgi:sugar/nucleoside kinase (ribokinase family)